MLICTMTEFAKTFGWGFLAGSVFTFGTFFLVYLLSNRK